MAKEIQITYYATASIPVKDIEDALNIKWENVKDWYAKYETIYLTMHDGRLLKFEAYNDYYAEVDHTITPLRNTMNTEKHVVCRFENEIAIPISLIEEILEISWADVRNFSYSQESLKIEMQNDDVFHYCMSDDVRYMTENAQSVEIEEL